MLPGGVVVVLYDDFAEDVVVGPLPCLLPSRSHGMHSARLADRSRSRYQTMFGSVPAMWAFARVYCRSVRCGLRGQLEGPGYLD